MKLIATYLARRRERKKCELVNKLLRKRAGIRREVELMNLAGRFFPAIINDLGVVEEHLRQLGWKGDQP